MKIKCLFKGHNYIHCRCVQCGKRNPKGGHVVENCVCKVCGEKLHDWEFTSSTASGRSSCIYSSSDECTGCGTCQQNGSYEIETTYTCKNCGATKTEYSMEVKPIM